jgi:hypothetical protein
VGSIAGWRASHASGPGPGRSAERGEGSPRLEGRSQGHGREGRTLAEITLAGTDKKGEFIDRDLYVFVYDFRGVCLAHGANPKLVGRNLWDLVDADGSYLIRGLVETARQGSGWYRYKWSNPLTKKIEEKLAYVKKVDDGLWLGSGVYGAQVSR